MRSREFRIRMKNKHTKRRLKKYSLSSWWWFSKNVNNVSYGEGGYRYINMLNSYNYFIAKETGTTFTQSKYKQKYSKNKSKDAWFEKGSGNTRIEQKEKFRKILKENGII